MEEVERRGWILFYRAGYGIVILFVSLVRGDYTVFFICNGM